MYFSNTWFYVIIQLINTQFMLIVLLASTLILLVAVLILLRSNFQIQKDLKVITENQRDKFLVNIHDLTTLLTSIRYYTEMLLEQGFGSLKISQIEMIHRIEENASKANGLCEKLHKPFVYKAFFRGKRKKDNYPGEEERRKLINAQLDSIKNQ